MLSHTTTRDWLIPYADGMLAADERRRIDGHIAGCAACAAELREVQAMANDHKPLLAEASLRAFRITIDDAAASLKNPANPQATRAAMQALRADLAAVEQANSGRADDDAEVKQLVLAATDELD